MGDSCPLECSGGETTKSELRAGFELCGQWLRACGDESLFPKAVHLEHQVS